MSKTLCDYRISQDQLTKKELSAILAGKKIKGKVICTLCTRTKPATISVAFVSYINGEGVGQIDAEFVLSDTKDVCPVAD